MKTIGELCQGDYVYTINRNYHNIDTFPVEYKQIKNVYFNLRNPTIHFEGGGCWIVPASDLIKPYGVDIAIDHDKAFEIASRVVGHYNIIGRRYRHGI